MNNQCHICNKDTKYFMNKDGFILFKCTSCDLVYMNPLPEQNYLKDEVYSFESGYQSNKPKDLYKTKETKKTKDILNFLDKSFDSSLKNKRILDVGCSNGEFIFHAKNRGFEVCGVELNKRTADIANNHKLNVFNGLLNDANYPDNYFDAIFLGDIIEHVLSPRDFIAECNRILKINGFIIISTPNLDCLWSKSTLLLYKYFNIPWSSVTPPHHTFQFSISNLDNFMSQFKMSKINSWYYKPPRLMYELGSLHLLKKYKKERSYIGLLFMIFSFGIYSIVYTISLFTRIFIKRDFSMIAVYKKSK